MSIKFESIKVNSPIILSVYSGGKRMTFNAVITKHLGNGSSIISIKYATEKRLNFDHVGIDVLYSDNETKPVVWRCVRIITKDGAYVLQTSNSGVKSNRRSNTRIPVSVMGRLTVADQRPRQVVVKDVSMKGFGIVDRNKELKLSGGTPVSLSFEDLTYQMTLKGKVVRKEEHDKYTIYGMIITGVSQVLPIYIHAKQGLKTR